MLIQSSSVDRVLDADAVHIAGFTGNPISATELKMKTTNTWGQVGIFLALVVAISSVFYVLMINVGQVDGGDGAYVAGLMWAPGLAALLTCRFCHIPLGSLGWTWGAWRWQWLAYLIPLTYAALAYGFIWSMGFGRIDPNLAATIRHTFGWGGVPDALAIGGWFVLVGTTGMVGGAARALGEEIGWRGFLAPRLNARLGFKGGAIVTGFIWTAWHVPLLLFADYNNGTPWWYSLGCFTLLVLGVSVIMAWMRLRSGSLWPAVLLHASHNLFIQNLFTPATSPIGLTTPYAIGEFGFAVPGVILIFAIGILVFAKEARGGVLSV